MFAGRSKAVELAYNGYPWLDKSWAVAYDGGARRGAMACFGLPHAWTENETGERTRRTRRTHHHPTPTPNPVLHIYPTENSLTTLYGSYEVGGFY